MCPIIRSFQVIARFLITEIADHSTIASFATHRMQWCGWTRSQPPGSDWWGYAFRYVIYVERLEFIILNYNLSMNSEIDLSLTSTGLKKIHCCWSSQVGPNALKIALPKTSGRVVVELGMENNPAPSPGIADILALIHSLILTSYSHRYNG